MATVREVATLLDSMVPNKLAEPWDNVGLLWGRQEKQVKRILLALDLTKEVVAQAIEQKIDMVLTHHPVIFNKLGSVTDDNWQQDLLLELAEHGIAAYSAHTNLDIVVGGVNDALAKVLKIEDTDVLDDKTGLGRIGTVEKQNLEEFAAFVKKVLKCDYVTVGNAGKKVHRVAICGGAGSDLIPMAIAKGADTFITGDVKYHSAQQAVFGGLNFIDAGHQTTEWPVVDKVADRLSLRFTELDWQITIKIAKESLLLKHL